MALFMMTKVEWYPTLYISDQLGFLWKITATQTCTKLRAMQLWCKAHPDWRFVALCSFEMRHSLGEHVLQLGLPRYIFAAGHFFAFARGTTILLQNGNGFQDRFPIFSINTVAFNSVKYLLFLYLTVWLLLVILIKRCVWHRWQSFCE